MPRPSQQRDRRPTAGILGPIPSLCPGRIYAGPPFSFPNSQPHSPTLPPEAIPGHRKGMRTGSWTRSAAPTRPGASVPRRHIGQKSPAGLLVLCGKRTEGGDDPAEHQHGATGAQAESYTVPLKTVSTRCKRASQDEQVKCFPSSFSSRVFHSLPSHSPTLHSVCWEDLPTWPAS